MNYLRGALQYYKDLPPINPATLTGAIDVIVVRRPAEQGDYELASSPFHVRFGKWQILRPADKKVSIAVNGKPAPFPMKIGEAGEAFFVFETTEDVEDDLITSPLTSPLHSPLMQSTPDLKSSNSPRVQASCSSVADSVSSSNNTIQEPEFLDLDADPKSDLLQPGNPNPSDNNDRSVASPSSVLGRTKELGRSIVTAAVEGQKDASDRLRDEVRIISNNIEGKKKAFALDGLPSFDADSSVQLPEVDYREDVVLDPSGYHSKPRRGPSEKAVVDGLPLVDHSTPPAGSRTYSSTNSTASNSRAASPDSSEATSPEMLAPHKTEFLRGRSAPPDLRLSSSSGQEYEWDWGAFPQLSPIEGISPSTRASLRPAVYLTGADDTPTSTYEECVFGAGGLLNSDFKDPYQFILGLDSTLMTFQISSCGLLSGNDEVEDESRFNSSRVSYRRFMAESHVVKHPDLVIRWGEKCVSRSDSSPLFNALAHWRENTLSSQEYPSDGEPVSSGDEGSEDEAGRRHKPKSEASQSGSSWSRWWSRGSNDDEGQRNRFTDLENGNVTNNRPDMQPAYSESLSSSVPGKLLVSGSHENPRNTASKTKRYAKTLRLSSEQLKLLDLKSGPNEITFSLSTNGIATCTSRIFLWDSNDLVVVSDIDGTITKSDALGHVFTLIGRDWTHIGVAKLYTDICRNGYKIMYLTSRAIGQADSTRGYLKNINQNNHQLPEGPVIMSPDRLIASLHREVIMRKPEVFKMACLRDIARLFGPISRNPFYAGFGNRITDALSYRSVDIPSTRIFTIDSTGEVKTELLEKAGYKSSYTHMSDLVDQQFPPINQKLAAEYTEFNFWRQPLQQYEFPLLTPPSPTLSARSDTSNQTTLSRLRQFSLGRSAIRSNSVSPQGQLLSETDENLTPKEVHARSMSSFGRLKSLVGYPASESASVTGMSFEEAGKAERRLSNGSMPGSLPDLSHFPFIEEPEEEAVPDEKEYEEQEGYEDEESDRGTENQDDLFDEDLFATGEMKNVPFL